MERFFVAAFDGTPGMLAGMSHGPFMTREDAMAFLARSAPAGRWRLYTAQGGDQFDVPDRVVRPVAG